MKKNTIKKQAILILFVFYYLLGMAQSDSNYFYYYKGKKIFLKLDTKTICISSSSKESSSGSSKLRGINYTASSTRNSVVAIDKESESKKSAKEYYSEVDLEGNISEAAYLRQLKAYNKEENVILASPCFKTEKGTRIGLTNNFLVKLKSKGDRDKLYEIAKKQKVEVLGYIEDMSLWFALACTKNTGFNALEMANIFYETGLFESTEPELMGGVEFDI